jgi:N utilization substance protein A
MEVIVNEDQLSLAIGKRGQNVRLATKLVGWNIDIRSEEEIKREVAAQMGAMIASGEAVPLERLQGMNPSIVATLAERGIGDIEALAGATIDDIVEFLDVSMDEAERLISSAQAVIDAASVQAAGEGEEGEEGAPAGEGAGAEEAAAEFVEAVSAAGGEMAEETEEGRGVEQHAVSVEADPEAGDAEVEPSEAMIAEGYDEAARTRTDIMAEDEILAADSADPVSSTEVEQMSADQLLLQGAGRDLRPDTITPAPDITSAEAAVIQHTGAFVEEERPSTLDAERAAGNAPNLDDEGEDDAPFSPRADFASEASAPEIQTSSEPGPESSGEPAGVENAVDDEATNASVDE